MMSAQTITMEKIQLKHALHVPMTVNSATVLNHAPLAMQLITLDSRVVEGAFLLKAIMILGIQ